MGEVTQAELPELTREEVRNLDAEVLELLVQRAGGDIMTVCRPDADCQLLGVASTDVRGSLGRLEGRGDVYTSVSPGDPRLFGEPSVLVLLLGHWV